MKRIPRQDVERAISQLAREQQLGLGLEKDTSGRTAVKVSGVGLRKLQDGSVAIDVEALAGELIRLASVLLVNKRGKIAFSSGAVDVPLSLDAVSGAIQLDIGNALELDQNDKLAVVAAADPGDSVSAGTVAVLESRYNTLLANLRTAGLIA